MRKRPWAGNEPCGEFLKIARKPFPGMRIGKFAEPLQLITPHLDSLRGKPPTGLLSIKPIQHCGRDRCCLVQQRHARKPP